MSAGQEDERIGRSCDGSHRRRRDRALPVEQKSQLTRAVIASTIGTTIEWYDFFLYSTVTGLVFAKLYLPGVRSAGRHAAGVRHLCGRLCRAAGRRRDLRPLRRPHRPQVGADRDAAADGHRDVSRGVRADLCADRHLGRGHPDRPALHPGRRASAASGAARCCWRWSGRGPTSIAASSPRGRNSACRPDCSSRTWRCWRSARSPATQFLDWGWRIPFFLSIVLVGDRPLDPARHSRDADVRAAGGGEARSRRRRCSR